MREYQISIELLSDTMPGSGESVPGTIDSDIRYDSYGIPYMNAKTLKGHLREQMEMITAYAADMKDYPVRELLGSSDKEAEKKQGRLKFTDVTLGRGIRSAIQNAIDTAEQDARAHKKENTIVTANDIINALTLTASYTSIERKTGIVKAHSLRRERILQKGLTLYSTLYFDTDGMMEEEINRAETLLDMSVRAIQHIGTHKSKGMGHVRCRLKSAGEEQNV
ncbi:MAG: hypothetical protein IKG46_12610 [Solobacterium sp.]|nr:hypothetical protein [Solobacterium sp.]